jgi:glycosyltransferase involved in cell wall biosynthesis
VLTYPPVTKKAEDPQNVTGLIVPLRDSDALGKAMSQILSDPALARRMGDAGRQRAEALYDERSVLDREVQVYQKLVEEKLHQDAFGKSPARTGAQYEEGK